jgi:OOP family OmpA-OmpF porin
MKARYPEGRFHPYVGVGVGYSYFQMEGSGSGESISGSGFCWQLMTGLDFDITPNLGVGIGYKYFATKPTIGSKGDSMYADIDYKASIVTVGLTYTF